MSSVRAKALIVKERNPGTGERDVWEDPIEAEDSEPSSLKGDFLSEE